MPPSGATFYENGVPPWTSGDFRGVNAGTNPPRRCAPPLPRRGFSEELLGLEVFFFVFCNRRRHIHCPTQLEA